MTNWMTTLSGTGVIFAALAHAITAFIAKDYNGVVADLMGIVGGLGLLSAKDFNVTGAGDSAVKK